jgi:hypothetical protein
MIQAPTGARIDVPIEQYNNQGDQADMAAEPSHDCLNPKKYQLFIKAPPEDLSANEFYDPKIKVQRIDLDYYETQYQEDRIAAPSRDRMLHSDVDKIDKKPAPRRSEFSHLITPMAQILKQPLEHSHAFATHGS